MNANGQKYRINKHRHYELKHFCLQYPEWKRIYYSGPAISSSMHNTRFKNSGHGDPTANRAIYNTLYLDRIQLIEKIAKETDKELYEYILKAVTEGLSYTYLKTKMGIPCGRDMYYDRYRRFFWLLSKTRI